MLDLSPHLFSPTFDWHVEEDMIDELIYGDLFASNTPKEIRTSHNSVTSSPPLPDYEHDAVLYNSDLAIKDHSNSAKKSSHNAYERDRRKKLNSLYSSLRSLLPETNQNKKLSIPTTVARVIKHIPELQRQIERLIRRKEEILLRVSKEGSEVSSSKVTYESKATTYPVVSATCLNRREFMVQMVFINKSVKMPLSKVVKVLEEEGVQLMNASTLAAHADSTFYCLHLQAKDPIMMEGHIFCEHLMSVLKEQARVG